MSNSIEQRIDHASTGANPVSVTTGTLSSARLNPIRLGWGFGATGVVFYLGCMIMMAIVPREKAVVFFNSLLHGIDVEPILKNSVPAGEIALGLITMLILGWFAGVLVALFYNFGLTASRS